MLKIRNPLGREIDDREDGRPAMSGFCLTADFIGHKQVVCPARDRIQFPTWLSPGAAP
jgi:hypothetical protein